MPRTKPLPERINSWTVIDHQGSSALLRCDCGTIKLMNSHTVRTGKSKRCIDCARGSKLVSQKYYGTRIYRIWQNMRTRCNNPKRHDYRWYGARGITVCERWNMFLNFLEDMGELPTQLHTIDRIDVNGNYEPSNCRWATMEEQRKNMRPKSIHTPSNTGEMYISYIEKDNHYKLIFKGKYIGVYKTLEEAKKIKETLCH